MTTTTASSSKTDTDCLASTSFVFKEAIFPGVLLELSLKRIMVKTKSEFQDVSVIETAFGKTLVTDGLTQSSQIDEFMYHESLVHPALIKVGLNNDNTQSSKPKRVFIGGGGELATAREVLRHKSVEKVVMVDLDKVVLDVCKEHLPEWGGQKVASNPRLELIIGDAYEYLMNCNDVFDVIIMDISDPIEAGPGIMLYTQEFYQHAKTLLSENGVFVTQAGTADSVCIQGLATAEVGAAELSNDETCFAPITNTLNSVFDCVLPYSTYIPSFGSDWGFVMAFSSSTSKESARDYVYMNAEVIDDIISNDITDIDDIESNANGSSKSGCDVLKFYDGESHRGMFSLPKPVRVKFQNDKRIMTRDNPVFMFC
jgi:spermidine synthase